MLSVVADGGIVLSKAVKDNKRWRARSCFTAISSAWFFSARERHQCAARKR
jgi:hypothetical protein